MPDYVKLAEASARKRQISQFAPECCLAYRRGAKISQAKLARLLGTHAAVVCALEKGVIRNWMVAEAAIILNGEDMELLRIEETPDLRRKLDEAFRLDMPINMLDA